MTRIAIMGVAGRMGRTLVEAVGAVEGLTLAAGIVESGSSLAGVDIGELAGQGRLGVVASDSLAAVVDDFDVVIDFTAPQVTLANLALCAEHGKRMVIGTTGFTPEQLEQLDGYRDSVPFVFAANMSSGVNLTLKLLELPPG